VFANYLRVALRSLRKQKGYTAINVLGLAVGIAGALLVGLFLRGELAFDRFHEKAGRIHRMWVREDYGPDKVYENTVTPYVLGPTVAAEFPEVEHMTRFKTNDGTLRRGQDVFAENVVFVDAGFLDVFSFPLLGGDRATALARPDGVVLTDSAAARLFGASDPLGQPLTLRIRDEEREVVVTGVARVPASSGLRFDALVPFALAETGLIAERHLRQWHLVSPETYVLLREGASAAALEAKLPATIRAALGPDDEVLSYTAGFQPLLDIHLNPDLPEGIAAVRDPRTLWILAGIAALVLLIACINFTTLALGRSLERAREVGVRKALGARRAQLMRQFWGEAALLTLLALAVGVGLALLGLPLFSRLAEQPLAFRLDGGTAGLMAGAALVVALFAGAYPALVLSRFQPTEALRGRLRIGTGGGVQRGLVALQFALSIGLVASTFVMAQQLRYLQTKRLGYEPDRLVMLPNVIAAWDSLDALAPLQARLEAEPAVAAVTGVSFPLGAWGAAGYPDEAGAQRTLRFNVVAPDFLEAMRIPLVAGAGFADAPAAAARQAVVNRAYVEAFGLGDDPVGRPLPAPLERYAVAGVTGDFHFSSLHEAIEPAVLVTEGDSLVHAVSDIGFSSNPAMDVVVRLGPGPLPEAMAAVERALAEAAPAYPFEYEFVDEALDQLYREEARLGRIVSLAALLAVFVAALGLFGLAALTAAQRTKEIGVRRVLGASVRSIVGLLSKDLARLVVAGFVVAAPAAWWLMRGWLEAFAYRVDLGPGVFVAAGALALLVALAATAVHALRAASADPVRALRSE
jgi:putative ABC transport system permease protein